MRFVPALPAQKLIVHYTFDELEGVALDSGSGQPANGTLGPDARRTTDTPFGPTLGTFGTFGSSFGTVSFGAQIGLNDAMLANDLTVVGSLAGGGSLGEV